jgi:hypothetical protein
MISFCFTFIPIGKLVSQLSGCSGKGPSHKLLPHCTSSYQVICLRCVNTGIRETVDG